MAPSEVPEIGSEWLYGGRRIRVQNVIVQWSYVDSDPNNTGFLHAELKRWGKSFVSAPLIPEPGKTYEYRYPDALTTFYVYEVFQGTVWGREQHTDDDYKSDWYKANYSLEDFKGFKEVSSG